MMTNGSRKAVSITVGGRMLARDIDAILRHEQVTREETIEGIAYKSLIKQVDVLTSNDDVRAGLKEKSIEAKVEIDGEVWGVEQLLNVTETFIRLELKKFEPLKIESPGFRRES
jgi:hypothetical protein